MSNFAIRCESLSKEYRIGEPVRYKALRDVIANTASAPFHRLRRALHNPKPAMENGTDLPGHQCEFGNEMGTFWALDDISFEVSHGEVLGIVGPNGAGKSTLLKILSRITRPTKGHAEIHGRIGSLLEVGTGFHPELSGRENIYLNAAILGMRRAEVERKFEEIVAFAEVEQFIDTPVKRYSSGMYVRLAFAVAAHLDPEILLIDEVLAVGDAAFQKKCLGKIGDVTKQGRTVLFVSHNMQSIARLCSHAVLLEQGRIKKKGNTSDVVAAYLQSGLGFRAEKSWSDTQTAPGNGIVRLKSVRARNTSGNPRQTFDSRESIGIEIGYNVLKPISDLAAELVVYDSFGNLVFTSANQYDDQLMVRQETGHYISTCWIPGNLMTEGTFFIRVSIVEIKVPVKMHVFEENILIFQIIDRMDGDSARGRIAHNYPGIIRPRLSWTTTFSGDSDSQPEQSQPPLKGEMRSAAN